VVHERNDTPREGLVMPGQAFKRGDRIRDTYNGRTGYITGKNRPYGESFLWEASFDGANPEYIREAYLELLSDNDDMFSLFEQCRFSGVLDLRRKIQQIRLNDRLTNLFYSMHNSETEFMPHQFKPVMKFIESATGRLLIADEVGLGKTIEAIYIWKELLTRQNAKRLLIVCPAQLCQKWKDDLLHWFGIPSSIVNATGLLERLNETRLNINDDNFVLITSIQGIRYKEKEENESKDHNARSKLNDFFTQYDSDNKPEIFDLVVIDEAHYLRNSSTASFNTGEKLRDISLYMILLSATPIQTSSDNFFNLLRLLSPEDYYNSAVFNELLTDNRSIIMLANAIRNNHDKKEVVDLYNTVKEKLIDNKTLNDKILVYIKNQTNSAEERMSLFQILKDSSFYSQYFTRTRKRDVDLNKIDRGAEILKFPLSPEEHKKYQEVTDHINKLSVNSPMSRIFTLIARQRQMTSCLPAALQHWKDNETMEEILYEDMGIDTEDEFSKIILDNNIPNIETSEEMIKYFTRIDSKYQRLLEYLKKLKQDEPDEKVIIFSFYRYTIHYLHDRLSKDGFICEKMMGGMGDEKINIIEHFRDSPECNILISSEVGSEGIDLQFASIEVNYDLPWNPMRIEQRIGRIDRIGQKRDKIRILNLYCENTIEDRVIDRLYERIGIFTQSIGDIEEIMGNKIHEISKVLLDPNLSDEEKIQKAENQIDIIANNKNEMEKLEEQAAMSAEFSDMILENINNANNNRRYIMPEELIQYTYDFFSLNYSGTRIQNNDSYSLIITLSTEAQMDFRDFLRVNHCHAANLGYRNDVFCIFNGKRDAYKKRLIVEMIDINHPFIRWMKDVNSKESLLLYDCSAVSVKRSNAGSIKNGLYVYFIQKWNAEGYRNIKELKYFVINAETKEILNENISENLVINAINYGYDYSEIKYGLNNFDLVVYSMNKLKENAISEFDSFDKAFLDQNRIICERNTQYLEMTIDRKITTIKQQLEKARQNGQPEKIIRMHEGKLNKTEESFSIQKKKLESKIKGRCIPSDIAVGLIKVEE